jgi:hypothetical protein
MFDLKDLRMMGLLTEDDWFVFHAARDCNNKKLNDNQLLRVYGAHARTEVPELVVELKHEGLDISPDMLLAIAQAMDHQWAQHGEFPCDPERRPEPYNPHRIPVVVRNAMVRTHLPWQTLEDMRNLVKRYRGDFLRAELQAADKLDHMSEQIFADLLRAERQQAVVTRICVNPACGQVARTTLEQAVAAIEKYHLLPQPGQPWSGKLFTPHQRCATCRALGRTAPKEERPRREFHNRSGRRGLAALCEAPRAKRGLEAAAMKLKSPPPPAPEPEPQPESVPPSSIISIPAKSPEA